MDTTLYVALSHQVAQRRQMDVIANNIANMGTTAFKRESVMFREYLKESDGELPNSLKNVAYVQDYGVSRQMTDGQLHTTGNPFDIALSGDGMLMVKKENGDLAYTRNGHLALSDEGKLITSTGQEVLDVAEKPIQFPANATGIEFATDGTISVKGGGIIGKINVVTFEDFSTLQKIGNNMFGASGQSIPSTNFQIVQGVIESSNVQPIIEITKMINVSRAYIQTAKIMERFQDSKNNAINRLAKLS